MALKFPLRFLLLVLAHNQILKTRRAPRAKVLLVKRRSGGRWMFLGGKHKGCNETSELCMRREIGEELPKLKVRSPSGG
jgi:8-oxo-dGTP pyrophosphatase MutT (NUDIX family)